MLRPNLIYFFTYKFYLSNNCLHMPAWVLDKGTAFNLQAPKL